MPSSFFTFEPCGQGLFVHGTLECPGLAPLNVVFDCGTSSSQGRLSDSIHEYRAAYGGPDILVLSHLHDDHVSGVPQLLNGHQCEAIILPYLSPLARAAAAAASGSDDPEYLELVADPVRYFLGGEPARARRIIFVEEGGEDTRGQADDAPDGPENDVPGVEPGSRERMISKLVRILETAGRAPQPGDESAGATSAGQIRIIGDAGSYRLTPCWSLRFLTRDPLGGRSRAVQDRTRAVWDAFELAVRAILAVPQGAPITTVALARGLSDSRRIEALRRAYQPLGDLNTNGLSLWIGRRRIFGMTTLFETGSAFLGTNSRMPCVWIGARSAGRVWRRIVEDDGQLQNRGTGILLNADGSFDVNGQELLAHFSRELPSTGVVQVPHHGSRLSWNDGIFRAICGVVATPCLWPLNAGILNRYGHPHHTVITALERTPDAIMAANHEHSALHIRISA